MRDRVRVVSFDGPGFGDSDRPALGEDAALRRTSLEGVLTDLDARQHGPAPLHPGDGVSGPDPRR
ncbi:hypothetical protein L107_09406 [Cyanobium sp. Copco_Reservoir_LC18]|uniref:hypothetical protein n=1 Tax=Cyanobium sp. Copco_Reservoir_LC18 TaxID=1328305 RepID=UPI00135CDCA7|nr:hypothetical protein [Cyanobium sp. Copco_Reservoir_LC18]KAF0653360.1 hypothetical protein L107_09406 [Cyanobium sp. Copco_Reservoir_LC18]